MVCVVVCCGVLRCGVVWFVLFYELITSLGVLEIACFPYLYVYHTYVQYRNSKLRSNFVKHGTVQLP